MLHHVEDDLPEVLRAADAPGGEDRRGEEAVLLQAIAAGGLAEFLTRHVPLGLAARPPPAPGLRGRLLDGHRLQVAALGLVPHAERLLGERQRLEHEQVGVERVAAVTLQQLKQRMGRIDQGHAAGLRKRAGFGV